ncbi:MAG: class I SAM-dependent methyltransferase [Alphaproteobacteria bacterium]|nr:class I SAM-dependent methyltransferase [Alphaproteobacteria bacterium]
MLEKLKDPEFRTVAKANQVGLNIIKQITSQKDYTLVAEIGVGAGASSLAYCEALKDKGELHIFDFQDLVDDLEKDLKAQGCDNIRAFGNTKKHWDSYNWTLASLLMGRKGQPMYDYIYIDGAHTFFHDGLCFFLCDKLLNPGGVMELDDYYWSYGISPTGNPKANPKIKEFMTDEQINTTQVALVVELFVKTHPSYREVIENRVYQKAQSVL